MAEAALSQNMPPDDFIAAQMTGEAYETLLVNVFLSGPGIRIPGIEEDLRVVMNTAEVASRLGTFDEDRAVIIAPE